MVGEKNCSIRKRTGGVELTSTRKSPTVSNLDILKENVINEKYKVIPGGKFVIDGINHERDWVDWQIVNPFHVKKKLIYNWRFNSDYQVTAYYFL